MRKNAFRSIFPNTSWDTSLSARFAQILFPCFMLLCFTSAWTNPAYSQAEEFIEDILNEGEEEEPTDQDIKPQDVIFWQGQLAESNQNTIRTQFNLKTTDGFSIYKKNLKIEGPAGFQLNKLQTPASKKMNDPLSGDEIEVFSEGIFEAVFFTPNPIDTQTFTVKVTYVGCTELICLFPYTASIKIPVTTASQPTLAESTKPIDEIAEADFEATWAKRVADGEVPYAMLFLVVFVGGLLSNLTPCVYPMIPITLRLLGGQGHSPYISSTIYALGIVVTYSALGLVATLSGGLFGSIMASPTFNIVFAIIMLLLGVSMLGFGNLSKLQMVGNKLGSGKPSITNTFLMGAGAGLVAAPCTGPILAALLAFTAKHQDHTLAIGLLGTYSLGFALPYVLLGGAAAKVTKIKVPPQVQNATKLLFASIMFGLAFYYLRIPFYSLAQQLRSLWTEIATVALALGLALAAATLYSRKLASLKAFALLPTVILGLGVFAAFQWLTTAPKQSGDNQLVWYKSEEAGFAAASEANKPVLIDMWAEWCEACKKMDATTFIDQQVKETLHKNWILIKLDLTESNDFNDSILEKYELQGLPTLVLLPSSATREQRRNLAGYIDASALLNELSSFHKALTEE